MLISPGQPVTTIPPPAFGGPCRDGFCHPCAPPFSTSIVANLRGRVERPRVLCPSTDASGRKTSEPSSVTSRPSHSVRMITSLESETPQNAERGIETGIPFEVDSRISNGKGAWVQRFPCVRYVVRSSIQRGWWDTIWPMHCIPRLS